MQNEKNVITAHVIDKMFTGECLVYPINCYGERMSEARVFSSISEAKFYVALFDRVLKGEANSARGKSY